MAITPVRIALSTGDIEYLFEYLFDETTMLRDELNAMKAQMKAAKAACPCRVRNEPECDG